MVVSHNMKACHRTCLLNQWNAVTSSFGDVYRIVPPEYTLYYWELDYLRPEHGLQLLRRIIMRSLLGHNAPMGAHEVGHSSSFLFLAGANLKYFSVFLKGRSLNLFRERERIVTL